MFEKIGLTPVVADETKPVLQVIHIEHNPADGHLTAEVKGASGLVALSLLADAAYAEYKYSFKAPDHPPIAGYGKVCIELENGELSLRFATGTTPETLSANPMIAKGMLLQAWWYLCEKTATGEFDARQALLEGLRLVKPKPKRKVKRGKRNNSQRKR